MMKLGWVRNSGLIGGYAGSRMGSSHHIPVVRDGLISSVVLAVMGYDGTVPR